MVLVMSLVSGLGSVPGLCLGPAGLRGKHSGPNGGHMCKHSADAAMAD